MHNLGIRRKPVLSSRPASSFLGQDGDDQLLLGPEGNPGTPNDASGVESIEMQGIHSSTASRMHITSSAPPYFSVNQEDSESTFNAQHVQDPGYGILAAQSSTPITGQAALKSLGIATVSPVAAAAGKRTWKPWTLKIWFPMSLFIIILILLALNIHFGRLALRPHPDYDGKPTGFLSEDDEDLVDLSGHAYRITFCYIYLPNLLSTFLLSNLIQILDIEVKRIDPFRLLSRQEGATAQETFCAEHLTKNMFSVLWSTIRSRNIPVMVSHTLYMLCSVVLPLLSAAYFEIIPVETAPEKWTNVPGAAFIWAPRVSVLICVSLVFVLMLTCLGYLIWYLHILDTALECSPYSMLGLARLSQLEDFRINWQRVPQQATREELYQSFGSQRYALRRFSDSSPLFCVLPDGQLAKTPQYPTKIRTYTTGAPYWKEGKPLVFNMPVFVIFAALAVVWKFISDQFDGLSLSNQRLINSIAGSLIRMFLDYFDREHRLLEPLRLSGLYKTSSTQNTLEINKRSPQKRFLADPSTDFSNPTPIWSAFKFLRTKRYHLAASSLYPLLADLYVLLVTTTAARYSRESNDTEQVLTEMLDATTETRSRYNIFFIIFVGVFAVFEVAKSYSPVRMRVPRHPCSLAAKISYICSSETLLRDAAGEQRLKDESGRLLKYGPGWFVSANGKCEVRYDAAQNAVAVYHGSYPVPQAGIPRQV